MFLLPYLLGGALMWLLMFRSGVHATIAGVLLAFAIPFTGKAEDATSPSHKMENFLQRPVALCVLPLFALANTAVVIGAAALGDVFSNNGLGIMTGLVIGKPFGITLVSLLAVSAGLCRLPDDIGWRHVFGAGLLGGIGFTMSIFISNLAFADDAALINASKLAIIFGSVTAGLGGFLWLRAFGSPMPLLPHTRPADGAQ
jgi:NhaA family Na+:H+ antiporter